MSVVSNLVPDLHHFRGSFGGKHVVPLYKDKEGAHANLTRDVLPRLARAYGAAPEPEDVFAYAFALLAAPAYVETFWEALETPGPRLPVTTDAALFEEAAALGRELLWLHTYGERFVPEGTRTGKHGLPRGSASIRRDTPQTPERYPDVWAYDPATRKLRIGEGDAAGIVADVPPEVMAFSISGFFPVSPGWTTAGSPAPAARRPRSTTSAPGPGPSTTTSSTCSGSSKPSSPATVQPTTSSGASSPPPPSPPPTSPLPPSRSARAPTASSPPTTRRPSAFRATPSPLRRRPALVS